MTLWLLMLAVGALTFATRLSFIALFGRLRIGPRVRRALQFVPVAALTAIIAAELVTPNGALAPDYARLLAGALAAVVAWRTRNAILTVASGMATLWLLLALAHV